LLGSSGLMWTTGGDSPWFGQSIVTHEGHPVVESGAIGNGQQSWLQTTVNGLGRLSFWWKVSSDGGNDWLQFSLGGQPIRITGEVGWQHAVVVVPPGPQTLTWLYRKGGDSTAGLDAAWVDNVTFEPGTWLDLVGGPTNGQCQLIAYGWPGKPYEIQVS